jgi:hypothetical protein
MSMLELRRVSKVYGQGTAALTALMARRAAHIALCSRRFAGLPVHDPVHVGRYRSNAA